MINAMRSKLGRSFMVALLFLVGAGEPARAQEENKAETLMKKMGEKLTQAKSLKVDVKLNIEKDEPGELGGTLSLEEKDKADMALTGKKESGEEITFRLTSDGEHAMARWTEGKRKPDTAEKETPEGLNRDLASLFAQGGCLVITGAAVTSRKGGPLLVSDFVEVSNFTMGKRETIDNHETQSVEYRIVTKDRASGLEGTATVWIDTATHLPLKRVLIFGQETRKMTITETYTSYKLDGLTPGQPGFQK